NNEEKPPVTEVNEKPVITDIAPDEAEPVPAITDSIRSDTVKLAVAKDSAKAVQQDTAVFTADEESTDSAKYVEPDSSKYYLVAGSFKEKENADKFFAELENQGHDPFHLGKQGNFYIIGLGEYESEQEAFRAQDDFLEKHPESGVWIYQVN
ncbi:MAG: SPOR domain-containing protein, partial [Tangfeifania sp.]